MSLLSILYCFNFTIQAQTQVEKIINSLKDEQSNNVLIAAHRGDWFWAPENSIQAFQNCIDAGIDVLEIDVRLSKEGIPVVIHDDSLARTTTGIGKVADFTVAELKKLYLRDASGLKTKQRIPTLEEVLMLTKDKVIVYLDKSYDKVDKILPILRKTGTLSHAMFVLNYPYEKARKTFGTALDSVIFVPVVADKMDNLENYVKEYQEKLEPLAYQFRMQSYNGNAYSLLKKIVDSRSNAFVAATWPHHSINHDDAISRTKPDEGWGWLVDNGFRILETNRPYSLLEYLKSREMHK